MTAIYDEIEIEDFEFDAELSSYFYPCPCGDRFQITLVLADLVGGRVECFVSNHLLPSVYYRMSCWRGKK